MYYNTGRLRAGQIILLHEGPHEVLRVTECSALVRSCARAVVTIRDGESEHEFLARMRPFHIAPDAVVEVEERGGDDD
jgi:hypothetical protein